MVDLSQAGYLDSAGFAVLDRLLAKAALAVVVAPGSVLHAAAQLMGIHVRDTVGQAGASLRPRDRVCAALRPTRSFGRQAPALRCTSPNYWQAAG